MPDYNIYIRNMGGGGGNQSPIKAKKETTSPTTPRGYYTDDTDEGDGDDNGLGFIKNTIASAIKWVKVHPVATALVVAYKITKKVVDEVSPRYATQTGDYSFNIGWNNFKTAMSNLTNPVQYAWASVDMHTQIQLTNQRQEQARMFLGDATLNSITRRF